MNTTMTSLLRLATFTSLLCAVACSGGSDGAQQSQSLAANGCVDDEGAADKVTCNVDTDCDSDEFCSAGTCTGLDGEAEDETDCDADDAEEADDEDEGAADKVYCSVDADCDSDEFCSNGLCTGLDGDTE